MKQLIRKTLLALIGGVMCNAAWAQVTVPDPVYFNNFSSTTGLTIHGNGTFEISSDNRFGQYFHNSSAAGVYRTHYLELPSTALSGITSTKTGLSIGFWVNKESATDFFWSPLFCALDQAPNAGVNEWTMFYAGACTSLRYNLNEYSGGWCDFTHAQNDNPDTSQPDDNFKNRLNSSWLDDGVWHYYTLTITNSSTEASAKVYVDGTLKNSWTIVDATGLFNTIANLTYPCLGGNQYADLSDIDAAFGFDDFAVYDVALSTQQIRQIVFAKMPEKYFEANKGDLTEFINGDFELNANGWTGGTWWSPADWRTRSWRGTELNGFYELGSTGTMTYTLPNMPAGTYKVVAAARGYNGGSITAQIAGTSGTALTCVGDQRGADDAIPEINTNGVEMPYSSLGGFTTNDWGHNWRWITATGILNEIGNLVININGVGTSWMAIDDVHLYYVSDAYSGHSATTATTYCMSANGISENTMINLNSGKRCVTCDLVYTNPNLIIRTAGKISTAAGQELNNNKYSSTQLNKLVLYDGYSYTDYTDGQSNLIIDNGAMLYRNIPADQWCTLMVPFYPTNLDVMKVPSATDETTVTFVDAPTSDMNNEPMIVKSTAGVTKITGVRNGTYGAGYGDKTSGTGATMHGTYTDIAAVDYDNYILAHPSKIDRDVLLKVNSAVGLKPFRAYFTIPTSANMLDIDFDSETTGVAVVKGNMADGISEYFDLQGRKITNPAKGLYIVNGKKVIIK